ncbi:hypothetical protein DJ82_02800 [Halorubrum sp. Ib24]|uniref:hypothetical protein n=1 Tax=Halorubrum sp. Ib24 TaxID=1383850 RepID=UPI000B9878BA|nr:hypothetical protein [Halorubrum sp. Ib24]OYR42330.1 hypothetical protein DJ82_02800 [Halorubrum sp. Ib24]
MPTIEITDDDRDRIEALREELTAAHAGPYASVDTGGTLAYLLDLADAVDDPEREADPAALGGDRTDDAARAAPGDETAFDRDRTRERLESRPRRHGDPDAAEEAGLYEIAAAFDVTGRSDMTKAELVDAVLDAAESLSADPFSWVDVDLGDDASEPAPSDESETPEPADDGAETESEGDAGASQLNAMMSLLDTHDDKWREADGDARYEVELPDGDVETARTKDDVRAVLFRNY